MIKKNQSKGITYEIQTQALSKRMLRKLNAIQKKDGKEKETKIDFFEGP